MVDGNGSPIAFFVYGDKPNVPEYMERGGQRYRLITDHLGSVRLVANAADGQVEQRMDYDEHGNLLDDTNSGFQPFGYAGGLHDPLVAMARFGARDYDPQTSRWTSRDPIGFTGAATLRAYATGDPVNVVDPTGLQVSAPPMVGLPPPPNFDRRTWYALLYQWAEGDNIREQIGSQRVAISLAASAHGTDPDLIRAVIYEE